MLVANEVGNMRTAILLVSLVGFAWAGSAWAQVVTPEPPQPGIPADSAPAVVPRDAGAAASGEDWRFRWHQNRWWYWLPSEQWVYWDGDHWEDFSAPPQMPAVRAPASALIIPGSTVVYRYPLTSFGYGYSSPLIYRSYAPYGGLYSSGYVGGGYPYLGSHIHL